MTSFQARRRFGAMAGYCLARSLSSNSTGAASAGMACEVDARANPKAEIDISIKPIAVRILIRMWVRSSL